MTERQLVNCARCGAPVSEFDLGQPHLHCTNCGAEITVPESVEARAVAYDGEMHREEQRAERAARVEISTEESTTTVKKTRYGVWLIGYLAGLPVLATLYGFFAPPPDAPNQLFAQQVAAGVFFGLAILPIVLFIVLTLLPNRRAARAAAKRERLQLGTPCQGCGALVTFEPGVVSVTCTYCGVANVAPSQVAKPMIHWASDNASAAEKELAQARALDAEAFPAEVKVSREEFAQLAERAVKALPADMHKDLKGVPVTTQDLPDLEDLTASEPPLSPSIVGLFRGPPLTEPCAADEGPGPCRAVVLYRKNMARSVKDRSELDRQVEVTLLHEIGHLRGEDDTQLVARGLE